MDNTFSCQNCNGNILPLLNNLIWKWICINCQMRYIRYCQDTYTAIQAVLSETCGIETILNVWKEWSIGKDAEQTSLKTGLPTHKIKNLYLEASEVAMAIIKNDLESWRLGGSDVIVIVDIFPHEPTGRKNSMRPILCIAELSDVPPKFWYQALDFSNEDKAILELNKINIIDTIKSVVRPESTLVAPSRTNYNLEPLRKYFQTMVTMDTLTIHDNDNFSLTNSLAPIRKISEDICLEAQFLGQPFLNSFLVRQIWNSRYKNDSFDCLATGFLSLNECLSDVLES